ncbi:extracellular solute-binding protein [Planosporangium thailandense]|uniref:Extracellular solute-binding protein n=1 Tax=Planosporangium thailandense TaxID=765197 RepID=A0ABX0Y746_9ACTN|nr:extracellular solute-binding protein [Planosporangium thailandense]NJC74158.1 extracellular solute-binding protein [Planosporangium thailandense]
MSQETPPPRRHWLRRLYPYAVGFLGGILVLVLIDSVRGILDHSRALEPGDLVVLSGTDTSTGAQRQHLLDRWNADHPRNQARLEELPNSADLQHSGLVSQAQRNDGRVDVYNLDVTWIPEFAAAGYIRPFGSTDTNGFLPQPLASCEFDHKLWALPFNTDAGLLYYRTDVLGKGGERIPAQLPPSPEDMRQIASQPPATGAPGIQAGYVTQLRSYEGLTVNALEAIWAAGGEVVSPDGRIVLDPDQAARALEPLAQGSTAGPGQKPGLLAESEQDDEKQTAIAFASGTVTMMRNWPVWYGNLKHRPDQASTSGFDITAHFNVKPLRHSVLGGQDLAIATGTTKPKAAKALIEFLTNPANERTLFGDGGLPATRADAYRDSGVVAKQPYAPVLLEALKDARPRPVTTHYPLFSDTFQDIINQALHNNGKLPADAARRLANALAGRIQ